MDYTPLLAECPFLISPAALGMQDTNRKFQLPPHLKVMNDALMSAAFTPSARLLVNAPFQFGKSWLASQYFPAWLLLLQPHLRIALGSYSEQFAATFGSKVKDIVNRYGEPLGIKLREDTKAKNEWVIEGHGGGMVCKGRGGSLMGRPADVLLLDDLVKGAAEAVSPAISGAIWDWYQTVAFSRIGPEAPIIIVNVRWTKNDLCGRILEEARETGEQWQVLKFKAIAEKNDNLGRQPGESLWEERVPLARLQQIQRKRGRWFRPCWQQEPEDEEGAWFHPRKSERFPGWPEYVDLGDAYSVPSTTGPRRVILYPDVTIIAAMDWAWSEKKAADSTSIGVAALLATGELLIRKVVNTRVPPHRIAHLLAEVCDAYHPSVVGVEVGHPTLSNEYRRFPSIPEIRWLKTESRSKLTRALPAITMSEEGRIYVPDDLPDWQEPFFAHLASFTGQGDEEDDDVDMFSYLCQIAQSLRGHRKAGPSEGPCMLTGGKEDYL